MTAGSPSQIDRLPHVPEKKLDESGKLAAADFTAPTPFVVRGLVRDWPLVQAGQESSDALRSYLLDYYNQQPVLVSSGPPEIRGRIFYDERTAAHIPEGKRGFLGPLTPKTAQSIHTKLKEYFRR